MSRSITLKIATILVFCTTLTSVSSVLASEKVPIIPKGQGDACVADTDFMRRNHMDLIVHQRDETVIRGIREEPFSLVECVACHARNDIENKPVRIDQKGEFCASCHDFAAVKIDCFTCHAAIPDQTSLQQDTAQDQTQDMTQNTSYNPSPNTGQNATLKLSSSNKLVLSQALSYKLQSLLTYKRAID